jgi:fused signal recognition particle receptor
VEWFSRFIQILADLLGDLGVPEASRTLGALGLLYVLVTLLVFLAIFALFRRLRRRPSEPPPLEPSEEVTPEAPGTPPPPAAARETQEPAPARIPVEAVPPVVVAPPLNLLERMRAGLAKTQTSLVGRIDALLGAGKKVDADLLEELEEILITADLGMKTTQELMRSLEKRFAGTDAATPEALRRALQEEIGVRLRLEAAPIDYSAAAPFVIMVVGVNGVGKTTTIGKLAHYLTAQGKKVVLGAGDTFRAAAAEQLLIWGERSGVDVICHDEGSDPAAVAFDAARAAVARKADVLIFDTAGRLHTKVNLMEELKKVRRVLDREIPGAPHETLLVLDATTGQNALVQARLFKETVAITGIALTKLDGTARGGIVVAIGGELNLPVRFVGIGEGIDDLRPFEPDLFVEALFQRD